MEKIYSVTEITQHIKTLIETGFSTLTLEGEISNYRPSASGHVYFTLKDEKAAISAVLFKGAAAKLRFAPKDGMRVHVTGNLSVYAQRGNYQIIALSIKQAGDGGILQMLEDLKKRLYAEGLFDQKLKKPLPYFPSVLAVITSPTGAALRDIIDVTRRRNPRIGITVLPAVVQGADAAAVLVSQIKTANRHRLGDVIILGRGGGSLEDLLPFSDEAVVRAVAESELPVISAVGHEIDWALSDFAADVRAPTPSAAAEIATPLLSEISAVPTNFITEFSREVAQRIDRIRLILRGFTPEALEKSFRQIEQPILLRLDDAKETMLYAVQDKIQSVRHRVELFQRTLEGADPHVILARGYSIVRKNDGTAVRSTQDVTPNEQISIHPANGEFRARVEQITHSHKKGGSKPK